MVLFEGDQIREGGPNPLADMVRGWTKSASGFGPAGPNPLADLARPDQICGGPNPLVHRQSYQREVNGINKLLQYYAGISNYTYIDNLWIRNEHLW